MRDTDDLLQEGIQAGQFGEGEPHGDHAMGFVHFSTASTEFRGRVADLGSGAGLPGLILADAFPETTWMLIERRGGRVDLLRRATRRLDLLDRITVVGDDARIVGWSAHRATFDWVTARSFGPPGHTAECAAPLLRPGGGLLVSEPRGEAWEARWPEEGLERCGLAFVEEWETSVGRYLRFERLLADLPGLPRRGAAKTPIF